MRSSYKREFIFGTISITIVTVLIILTTIRYEQKLSQKPIETNPQIGPTNVVLTSEEISKHFQSTNCWLILNEKIYIATDYLVHHPGGANEIIPYCGKDATQAFLTKGGRGTHSAEALRQLGFLYIGDLNGRIIQQPDQNTINSLPVGTGEDND